MDTCWSRRRLFQAPVVFSQLKAERLPRSQVALCKLQKPAQVFALMVAADRFVQPPPDQFHRVGLRTPCRKPVQGTPPPGGFHVFLNPFADVAAIVVHRQVQALVAVDSAQFFKKLQKQLVVFALSCNPVEATRREVQCSGEPHLTVGSWSGKTPLLSFTHPAKAHPGVELQPGLVLEEGPLPPQHLEDLFEPSSLLVRIFGGWDRPGSPPAKAQAMQHAANRLPTHHKGSLLEKLQGQEFATPARTQPTTLGGQHLFREPLDQLLCRFLHHRRGPSAFAVIERLVPLPDEASDDRVDGGTRAEEGAGDLGSRVTFGGKQYDVHSQPSAGFALTLHLADEILAFLRGDGDTLHKRPSLLWVDGFGVFTMPQRMAACSIILCIYLDPYEE